MAHSELHIPRRPDEDAFKILVVLELVYEGNAFKLDQNV